MVKFQKANLEHTKEGYIYPPWSVPWGRHGHRLFSNVYCVLYRSF